MDVFRHFDLVPDRAKGSVVAIGNFDGVHLGHQKLLNEARTIARSLHAPAGVLTFDPHPRAMMQPDRPPFGLMPLPGKVAKLRRQGLSFCFIAHFNRQLAETPAEAFVGEWLFGRLRVQHVVVGEDYRFGRKRMGDVDLLHAMGRRLDFAVTVVPPLRDEGGEVVSSSRIRHALASGQPREANRLLGQPWEILGLARRRAGDTVAISLAGYQSPVPGLYAVAAEADQDGENIDAPIATAQVVTASADTGNELLLPRGALPTDFPFLRVRVLDLLENHTPHS